MASANTTPTTLLDFLKEHQQSLTDICKERLWSIIDGVEIFGIKYFDYNKCYKHLYDLQARGTFFSKDLKYVIRGMPLRSTEIQILDESQSAHSDTDDNRSLLHPMDINIINNYINGSTDIFADDVILHSKIDGSSLCVTIIPLAAPQYPYAKAECNKNNLWVENDEYLMMFGTQKRIAMDSDVMIDMFLSALTGIKYLPVSIRESLAYDLEHHVRLLTIWQNIKLNVMNWCIQCIPDDKSFSSMTLFFEMILKNRTSISTRFVHTELASACQYNDIYFLEITYVDSDNNITHYPHFMFKDVKPVCSVPWFDRCRSRFQLLEHLNNLEEHIYGHMVGLDDKYDHPEGFMVSVLVNDTYRSFKLKPKVYYAAHNTNSHSSAAFLMSLDKDTLEYISRCYPNIIDHNTQQEEMDDAYRKFRDIFLAYAYQHLQSVYNIIDVDTDEHMMAVRIFQKPQILLDALTDKNYNKLFGIIFCTNAIINAFKPGGRYSNEMYDILTHVYRKCSIQKSSNINDAKNVLDMFVSNMTQFREIISFSNKKTKFVVDYEKVKDIIGSNVPISDTAASSS